MKKRTRQLDDAREVVIGRTADGDPIHTTAGELKLNGEDQDKLQDNVNAQAAVGTAEQAARLHINRTAAFLLKFIHDLAPLNVYVDYLHNGEHGEYFEAWRYSEGYEFHMDRLYTYIKRNGKVVAEFGVKGL